MRARRTVGRARQPVVSGTVQEGELRRGGRTYHGKQDEAVRHAQRCRIGRAVLDEDHVHAACGGHPTPSATGPHTCPQKRKHSREGQSRTPHQSEQDADADPEQGLRAGRDALGAVLADDDAVARDEVEERQEQEDVREDRDAGVVHLGVVEPPEEVRHEEDLEPGRDQARGREGEADFCRLRER